MKLVPIYNPEQSEAPEIRGVELTGATDSIDLALKLKEFAEGSYLSESSATEARRLEGLVLEALAIDTQPGPSVLLTPNLTYSTSAGSAHYPVENTSNVLTAVVQPKAIRFGYMLGNAAVADRYDDIRAAADKLNLENSITYDPILKSDFVNESKITYSLLKKNCKPYQPPKHEFYSLRVKRPN